MNKKSHRYSSPPKIYIIDAIFLYYLLQKSILYFQDCKGNKLN